MAWVEETQYRAKIGGLIYKNVKNPICINDVPVIQLQRNSDTSELGVSLNLTGPDGKTLAALVNNEVTFIADDLMVIEGSKRKSLISKSTGQIWLDLCTGVADKDLDLVLSCLIITHGGYPIVLHPERTKFGCFNDNKAPNISGLTLTTDFGSKAKAIGLNNSILYLLGICIENFDVGVDLRLEPTNEC